MVVLALSAGLGAARADARSADGELVSQQDLRERGPYRFQVSGVGEFEITKIDPGRTVDGSCSVHVASLRDGIAERHRRGMLDVDAGRSFTNTLALSECTDDAGNRVPCCKGRGELCTVNVTALKIETD